MYLHLAIHTPHPEAVEPLIASMHRFGDALRTQAGLIEVQAFKTDDGRLIGMALWESREAFERGRGAGGEAVKNDRFPEWEAAPIIGYTADGV